jgi:hypothetical protein
MPAVNYRPQLSPWFRYCGLCRSGTLVPSGQRSWRDKWRSPATRDTVSRGERPGYTPDILDARKTEPVIHDRNANPASRLAARIAVRVTTRTTVQTGLQVKPRVALQQTFRVASSAVLQVLPLVNFRVTMEFDPRTARRNAADATVGFAPEVGFRVPVRTTPRTVPGTVPKATRGGSALATLTASKEP